MVSSGLFEILKIITTNTISAFRSLGWEPSARFRSVVLRIWKLPTRREFMSVRTGGRELMPGEPPPHTQRRVRASQSSGGIKQEQLHF